MNVSGGNRIKYINSQAFGGLERLGILNLNLNKCINQEFRFIDDLLDVRKTIKERCGYCEVDVEELIELKMTLERKMGEVENLLSEAEKKNAEINEKDEKIKKLEEKIELLNTVNNQW